MYVHANAPFEEVKWRLAKREILNAKNFEKERTNTRLYVQAKNPVSWLNHAVF